MTFNGLPFNWKSPSRFGIGNTLLTFCRCCLTFFVPIRLLLRGGLTCSLNNSNIFYKKSSASSFILVLTGINLSFIDISYLIEGFNAVFKQDPASFINLDTALSSLTSFFKSILDVTSAPSLIEKIFNTTKNKDLMEIDRLYCEAENFRRTELEPAIYEA
ncbi:MAG: hypothetical protein EOP34_01775 [Rickettsiales bacterium]|nr:MAG: hypothetical protein EOP34_01775 [Rickettsiales bacterium]